MPAEAFEVLPSRGAEECVGLARTQSTVWRNRVGLVLVGSTPFLSVYPSRGGSAKGAHKRLTGGLADVQMLILQACEVVPAALQCLALKEFVFRDQTCFASSG